MFYQERGPTLFANRLFPLYRYRQDLAADDVTIETLFVRRHHSNRKKVRIDSCCSGKQHGSDNSLGGNWICRVSSRSPGSTMNRIRLAYLA